jgi:ABC-2 type transport system permease protein
LFLRRQEPLIAAINFIALPSVFLSSAMMPAELLPAWLNTLRHFNPVDYAVVGVRDLVLQGYVWSDLWICLLVLLAWSAAGITFGALMFRNRAE